MSFNELKTVENDPTIIKGRCIIFDFLESGNRQVITKEVAQENMGTLVGKRLSCKYIRKEDNDGTDALGSHESYEGINRYDEEVVLSNTEAIGFIEKVYIDTYVDKDGNSIEAVFGDIILWNDDKYRDIVGLIQEWLENGININMSCEYYYSNFEVIDGVEYVKSPIIFNAHTFLNSEDRGDMLEILPAYECAKLISLNQINTWNKALSQLNNKNKSNNNKEENKEMENKFLKIMNELSLGDVRYEIYYNKLAEVMTAKEYEYVYVGYWDIYDTYFVYSTYEGNDYVTYKVSYTKNGDDITIDYEGRELVKGNYEWVAVSQIESSENELKSTKNKLETSENELKVANSKIDELNEKIISLNEKIVEKSENKKTEVSELKEQIKTLNETIKVLQPMADKYNEEQFEKSFNSFSEIYKKKFSKVNALDVFEESETQELIKQVAGLDKETKAKAESKLNSLIVENINLDDMETSENSEEEKDDIMKDNTRISINSIEKIGDTEELVKEDTKTILRDKYGIV